MTNSLAKEMMEFIDKYESSVWCHHQCERSKGHYEGALELIQRFAVKFKMRVNELDEFKPKLEKEENDKT